MKGPIKNYTTEISAQKSQGEIEQALVRVGAERIMKEYKDGKVVSFSFQITLPGSPVPVFFKLPAQVEACFEILWKEVGSTRAKRAKWEMQAERTAWRIVRDWTLIQVAMIELKQAEFQQVFLPYVYDPDTNQTLYDRVKEKGISLLDK